MPVTTLQTLDHNPVKDPTVQAEIEVHNIGCSIDRLTHLIQAEAANTSHLADYLRGLADQLEGLADNGVAL